ncbi:MAG TPA: DUF58 domain-containing protein [Steroidobacteraceae bacterium]
MNLSARALVLIALTVALAIVGIWTSDTTLRGLWKLPAALILLGLAVEGVLLRRRPFSLFVDVSPRGYLGRPMNARMTLENRNRAPLTLEYAVDAPRGMKAPHGTRILRAPGEATAIDPLVVVPGRLGPATWPAIRVRILGAFGLASWPRVIVQSARIAVAPDLLGAAAQRVSSTESGALAGRTHGSGAELHQLREYRPGDPLHRIDWKASARRAGLVTREFTEDQHLDVIIALDAGRSSRLAAGDLDRLGAFANVAARFAEHAVSHDDRVGLVVYAERVQGVVPPSRGRAAVMRIRSGLEGVTAAALESSPLAAALRIRSIARQRSLILMLTDLDDVTTGGELSRAVRLLQMKHLVIVAGVALPDVEEVALAPAEEWADPYRALAAREWQARSRAHLKSLRSAGTPVIAARPADFESAVVSYYARLRRDRRV